MPKLSKLQNASVWEVFVRIEMGHGR